MVPTSPELIFVFRGPILRCSKGNLSAEVQQVVWHEVAHWLGHDEGEVKELGLSRSFRDIPRDPLESEAATAVSQQRLPDTTETDDDVNVKLRCLKCYSTDVTSRELHKPMTIAASSLSEDNL
jgi:predicted SprT family Zn-dependent metalloprotease